LDSYSGRSAIKLTAGTEGQ